MARGEQGIIFFCRLTAARPVVKFDGFCYDQLPVTVMTDTGPVVHFLKPISRILVTIGNVIQCSRALPIKFYIDESSCAKHPKVCRSAAQQKNWKAS